MQTKRLVYLDNLRSFALLLGLVFHTAIVYAESVGYAIKNENRSEVLEDFCYFVHSFRMPLFFFLSGFFSEMVLRQKGRWFYLSSRFYRLLVPFLVGMVLFVPIQYYIMDLEKGIHTSYLAFFLDFFRSGIRGLSHLWFLYYLSIFSGILLMVSGNKKIFPVRNVSPTGYYISFVCISLGVSLVAHSFFPKGYLILGIEVYYFLFYFSFFMAGVLAYYNQIIFREHLLGVRRKAGLFFLALVFLAVFENLERTDPLWMEFFGPQGWIRFFHLFFAVVTAWIFIYFLIELFKRFVDRETSLGIYLRDSSLPIYLIHHPVSLTIGYFLLPLDWNLWVKFWFHLFIVLLTSFTIYDSIAKPSFLWRKLLGVK